MSTPRDVLDHILASITSASRAQEAGARMRLAPTPSHELDERQQLALRLAAARHAPRPRLHDKAIVIACADHGVALAGTGSAPQTPTTVAVQHVASGEAAVNAVARNAGAKLVIVDCGIRGGDRADLGGGVVRFRICDGTEDFTVGPAMTPVDALTSVQTGIALLFSLVEEGLDVVALGQLSGGASLASAAIVVAMTHAEAGALLPEAADVLHAARAANPTAGAASPLEVLACFGGPDVGVMVGVILAAASINMPVVLDDHGTSAAALIARGLAPAVAGYLFASHGGTTRTHRHALAALGLAPVIEQGLSHGEGAGAGLALASLEAASSLLALTH